MKHLATHVSLIVNIFLGGVVGITSAEPISDRHLFSKAVISNMTLYMSDGQGEFPGHHASLVSSRLQDSVSPTKKPIPTGIHYYHFSPEQKKAAFNQSKYSQYPFSWDVVNNIIFSIAIAEDVMFKHVSCDVVRMTFEEIERLLHMPRSGSTFPNSPLINYILLRVIPLERTFQDAKQGQRVFFDFVPVSDSTIRLFIAVDGTLQIWENYASAEDREDLRKDRKRKAARPPRNPNRPYRTTLATQHASHSWEQVTSFPIKFDGPFYIIRFTDKTYLFCEYSGTVYQLGDDQLIQLLQLPFERETMSDNPFENIFIVDKDREQLTFFIPSFTQSEAPTVITLGEATSMRQGIEPTLRSALELYGVEDE